MLCLIHSRHINICELIKNLHKQMPTEYCLLWCLGGEHKCYTIGELFKIYFGTSIIMRWHETCKVNVLKEFLRILANGHGT